MKNESYYQQWILKAEDDVRWAENDFKSKLYEEVCFISQQIIEKSLKAFLIYKKQHLLKIHDLPALLARCIQIDESFSQFEDACKKITEYYIETRYPGVDFQATEKMAAEAVNQAKEIFEFVKQKLI